MPLLRLINPGKRENYLIFSKKEHLRKLKISNVEDLLFRKSGISWKGSMSDKPANKILYFNKSSSFLNKDFKKNSHSL